MLLASPQHCIAWLTEVNCVLTPDGTFLCVSRCRRESDMSPRVRQDPALAGAEQRLLSRICKNYSLPEIVPLSTYRQASARLGPPRLRGL